MLKIASLVVGAAAIFYSVAMWSGVMVGEASGKGGSPSLGFYLAGKQQPAEPHDPYIHRIPR